MSCCDTLSEKNNHLLNKYADLIHKEFDLQIEIERLREIEEEWSMMWATLEELNLVADVRENMAAHGFVFPTDEDVIA